PKYKFLVVACTTPLLVLVVNSQIHPFVESRPDMRVCQVPLEVVTHPFLTHDSWTSCVEAHNAFPYDELAALACQDPDNVLRGVLDQAAIRRVIEACNASISMPRRHMRLITEALSTALT